MKRLKAERESGISKLPGPILQHILSFLSPLAALRTCLVSKSWRYLGSTLPKLCLGFYEGEKERFMHVFEKSLQVYLDQKVCIEDLHVSNVDTDDPDLVSLLDKWVPIIIHDIGVKKLSFSCMDYSAYYDLPALVFESESLQKLCLERCKLSKINCIGKIGNHLKTLRLLEVDAEEESLANILSSCPLIERLSLWDCKGFKTIKMHNLHNLKRFYLFHDDDENGSIEIYLPSTIRRFNIDRCPNWFHNRTYFPGLKCLSLERVALSYEWFNSFSRNFPCLEDLHLSHCNGFDELKLSSPSIKKLHIIMDESTSKANIDAPSMKKFIYDAKISQSISFTATTSHEWNSEILLTLDQLDASQWFLKISDLVGEFSQSQIDSLVLYHHFGPRNNQHIVGHLSDISVCCSGSHRPVSVKSLDLFFKGVYYDSFFSDLMNGLFRIMRPREIGRVDYHAESLCRTLQLGRSEDEGMSTFWQHDLEEVSLELQVFDQHRLVHEWQPVQGSTNLSEYVKEKKHRTFRFRLKWRPGIY